MEEIQALCESVEKILNKQSAQPSNDAKWGEKWAAPRQNMEDAVCYWCKEKGQFQYDWPKLKKTTRKAPTQPAYPPMQCWSMPFWGAPG